MCPTKPRRQDVEWYWSAECDHVFGYYYHIVYRRSADLGKVNVDMVRVFMRENESRSKKDSQQHLTRICFPYPGISAIAKHVEQSSNNGLSFQHFCTFFFNNSEALKQSRRNCSMYFPRYQNRCQYLGQANIQPNRRGQKV